MSGDKQGTAPDWDGKLYKTVEDAGYVIDNIAVAVSKKDVLGADWKKTKQAVLENTVFLYTCALDQLEHDLTQE